MNINIDRIISKIKVNEIKKNFEYLRENYSVINSIKFLQFVRSQPVDSIFENCQYVFSEPMDGYLLYDKMLKSFDLSLEQLDYQQNSLIQFINKACNIDKEHLEILKDCLSFIESEIKWKSSNKYLKESFKYDVNVYNLEPVLENDINKEMDNIILNINYEPELINSYQNLINQINKNNLKVSTINFPLILVKNTALILSIGGVVTGAMIMLILSLPLLLVSTIISKKVDNKYIESYKVCLRHEIMRLRMFNEHDSKKKKIIADYIEQLEVAIIKLEDFKNNNLIKESYVSSLSTDEDELSTTILTQFIDVLVFDEEKDEDDDDMKIELEQFNEFFRNINKYQALKEMCYLEEGIISNTSKKITHGIKSTANSINNTTHKVSKVIDGPIDAFNEIINKYNKMDASERRNRIIEGQSQFNLFKIIKYGIASGLVWAVSPALAAIGLLTAVAINVHSEVKARKKILVELEDELKIVESKIDDAKSNDDERDKKYQLMRIKNKLEKDISRIRYGLDD